MVSRGCVHGALQLVAVGFFPGLLWKGKSSRLKPLLRRAGV